MYIYVYIMDILMSSLFKEKDVMENVVIDDDEVIPPPLELVRSETIRDDRFILDEEVKEENPYKWYEMIGENRIKRNNNDPNLTADGIPTIETQLKQIEEQELNNLKELTEEEKLAKRRKEILQRIKCIALDAMGKNILINPKTLMPREKREYVKRIEELYILSEEEIINMFNNICQDTIFQSVDYTNCAIYDC